MPTHRKGLLDLGYLGLYSVTTCQEKRAMLAGKETPELATASFDVTRPSTRGPYILRTKRRRSDRQLSLLMENAVPRADLNLCGLRPEASLNDKCLFSRKTPLRKRTLCYKDKITKSPTNVFFDVELSPPPVDLML